jgi:PAS domain S-box-containing protein
MTSLPAPEEHARLEEAVRAEAARLRLLTEQIPAVVWITDRTLKITSSTGAGMAILGIRPGQLEGQTIEQVLGGAPPDHPTLRAHARALAGESVSYDENFGGLLFDSHVDPLRDGSGAIIGVIGVALDATARKRAEGQLKCLSDANIMGLTLCDLNGTVREANDAFLRMTGYSREDLVTGKVRWIDMTPPEFTSLDVQAVEQLRAHNISKPYDTEYLRKDGSRLSVMVGASMIPGSKELCATFVLDVSDRRRMEEQLRQAQRMEVIGRLAGGVAHDFNNLLTPILGYSELLLEALPPGAPHREELEEIRKSGERAAGLTRQLLAFSRKQVLQPKVIDLNESVKEIQKLITRLIGEDVNLRTRLTPDIGRIKVDPGQLEQILMNLAVNSRDAMPGAGTLTIETADALLDDDYARSHPDVLPGPHVMLAVSDTGAGMSNETLSHLFEPFFTTKLLGKGTGLGLATVYGIVKQSLGHVFVYSEPGRGTTFKIYFPRVDEQASAPPKHAVSPKLDRGTETILIVEDDEALRAFTSRALGGKGYAVLEAGRGEEALMVAKGHTGPIHLLVTDVVMPGMSGREVAQQLLASRPRMKVLYVSGYTEDAIVHHGVLDEGTDLLEKPFNQETLSLKVRQVLDAQK